MEVTHHNDYNTHAILGGGEAQAFGIENNAQFVTMLSSTLYSNAFLAVAREVLCNAWDAHKVSGRRDVPINITIDEDYLVIRDHGTGIPHASMVRTYCVYGGTTKLADENQTGGFGLGAKSPFAYSDHFTVTNYNDGRMVVWAISRGNAETKGMPDARPIVDTPTTESGIEVKIPIKEKQDVEQFTKYLSMIAFFGEMNVVINDEPQSTFNLSQAEQGFVITTTPPPSLNGSIYVRYGDVVYPVPSHESYREQYDAITEIITEDTRRRRAWGGWEDNMPVFYLVIQAAAHSISVTPSRESLHISERAADTIRDLFNTFLERAGRVDVHNMIDAAEKRIIDQLMADPDYNNKSLLYEENLIQSYLAKKEGWLRHKNGYTFTDVERYALFKAAHGAYQNQSSKSYSKLYYRIKRVLQEGCDDSDLVAKLFRNFKKSDNEDSLAQAGKYNDGIFRRVMAHGISPEHFLLWDRIAYRGRSNAPVVYKYAKAYCSYDSLVDLTSRMLFYATARKQLDMVFDGLMLSPYARLRPPTHMVRVHVQRDAKNVNHEANMAFYRSLGFIVFDCRPPKVDKVFSHAVGNTAPRAPRKPFLGWPLLSNGSLRHMMREDKEKWKYTKKPACVVRVYSNTKGSRQIFKWPDYQSTELIRIMGDECALVLTDTQYNRAIKAGAVDAYEYISKKVVQYMETSTAYVTEANYDHWVEEVSLISDWIAALHDNVPGFEKLPVRQVELTQEETDYREVFYKFVSYRHYFSTEIRDRLDALRVKFSDLVDKTIPNPFMGVIRSDFATRITMFNIRNVCSAATYDNATAEERALARTMLQMALLK